MHSALTLGYGDAVAVADSALARPAPARRATSFTAASTDSRRAVLDAALEAFRRAAYDDVSVSKVARAAGVAQGLPFHYGSKRGLYLAVVQRMIGQLDEVRPLPERGAEPGPAVRRVLRRHMEFVATRWRSARSRTGRA